MADMKEVYNDLIIINLYLNQSPLVRLLQHYFYFLLFKKFKIGENVTSNF